MTREAGTAEEWLQALKIRRLGRLLKKTRRLTSHIRVISYNNHSKAVGWNYHLPANTPASSCGETSAYMLAWARQVISSSCAKWAAPVTQEVEDCYLRHAETQELEFSQKYPPKQTNSHIPEYCSLFYLSSVDCWVNFLIDLQTCR